MKLRIAICLCFLAASQVFAEDVPKPADAQVKIDPAAAAAATAVGAVGGPVLSAFTGGIIDPTKAAATVQNAVLALDSTGKAIAGKVGAVNALLGGAVAGHAQKLGAFTTAHGEAGKALVEIVSAINSLQIAGTNAVTGAAANAMAGVLGKVKDEALTIGKIYTQLLGEFGRAVGNGLNAIETLSGGVKLLHPVALGIDALEFHLTSLISFLKGAADISVANPAKAAALAPFIGTLEAVKGLLAALDGALMGPTGGVVAALDGAVNAAADIIGAVPGLGSVTNLSGLVQEGLALLQKLGV